MREERKNEERKRWIDGEKERETGNQKYERRERLSKAIE